jgi:uncharacterized membrane protein YgcG
MYRPVVVQARDADTKKPIPGAEIRLSYPLADPSVAPWQSVGTTGSDGTTQLRVAPYGDVGVLLDANALGYMTDQKNYSIDAVKAIKSPWFFESAGQRPVSFVVELYAEPFPGVELVLPNGYRGTVKVAVKIQDDAPYKPGQRLFSYEVPASGILQLTGPPLLRRVYSPDFHARYADGTILNRQAKDDEMGFFSLKSEGGFDYFLVGTKAEYDAFRHAEEKEATPKTLSMGSKGGGKGRRGGGGGGGGGRGGNQSSSSDSGQSNMSPE